MDRQTETSDSIKNQSCKGAGFSVHNRKGGIKHKLDTKKRRIVQSLSRHTRGKRPAPREEAERQEIYCSITYLIRSSLYFIQAFPLLLRSQKVNSLSTSRATLHLRGRWWIDGSRACYGCASLVMGERVRRGDSGDGTGDLRVARGLPSLPPASTQQCVQAVRYC